MFPGLPLSKFMTSAAVALPGESDEGVCWTSRTLAAVVDGELQDSEPELTDPGELIAFIGKEILNVLVSGEKMSDSLPDFT